MGKNGFDPAIKHGVQQFEHLGQWAKVCYWGYSLDEFSYGDRVFFQNQQGTYWLGTIERDCFVFILETPLSSVLESLHYLSTENAVYKQHEEDGWFSGQEELPF